MAVVVTYLIRGGGVLINSTTPPTATQAAAVLLQKAQIFFADADTQALFTHNWGLDASAPTFFDPEILAPVVVGPLQTAQTYLPAFTFDFSNTNVLTINKSTQAGTGGTFVFGLRKSNGPWQ